MATSIGESGSTSVKEMMTATTEFAAVATKVGVPSPDS
jgi:hypothetical protein